MGFTVLKRGQGMYARGSAVAILSFTALYGCLELYRSDLLQSLPTLAYVRGVAITWGGVVFCVLLAFLEALVCALTLGFTTQRARLKGLENKSVAFVDFLIEVEGELRKVAWPSRKQLVTSTGVVIGTMILFAVFIMGVDRLLEQVMRLAGIW